MTTTPSTWMVNQRTLIDVVLHRHALQLPCSSREVGYPLGGTRILVELGDGPGWFWLRTRPIADDAHRRAI